MAVTVASRPAPWTPGRPAIERRAHAVACRRSQGRGPGRGGRRARLLRRHLRSDAVQRRTQVPSLRSLGVEPRRAVAGMSASACSTMQMIGMLIGGLLWGVLGDRRGRLSSAVRVDHHLLGWPTSPTPGSQSVDTYAWLRLIAGIGLAGELGAGITLVSELVPARSRGWATTIVATVGIAAGWSRPWSATRCTGAPPITSAAGWAWRCSRCGSACASRRCSRRCGARPTSGAAGSWRWSARRRGCGAT
jgi:MFS family permease